MELQEDPLEARKFEVKRSIEELPWNNVQTIIGVKDAVNLKALIIYPDGTIQHRFPDWRLAFCISDPPKFLKEIKCTQELSRGYLPIVITRVEHEGIEYEMTSFAWKAKGRIIHFVKVRIVNKGTESKKTSFWFGLEGFTHTMEKMLRGFEKIIKYTDDHLVLDGFLTLMFQPSPNKSNLTYPAAAETMKETMATLTKELKGLNAADWKEKIMQAETVLRNNCLELAAKYELELSPKGETTIWLKIPTDNLGEDEGMKDLADISSENCLRECEDFWETFLDKGMKIRLPDKEVTDFYKASLAYAFITREHVKGNYIVKPGATIYDQFWTRDGEGIVRAFDVAGYHKEAEESLDYFIYLLSHPEDKWSFFQVKYEQLFRGLEAYHPTHDLPCTDSPVDDRGIFVYPFEPEKCFDCPGGEYDSNGHALRAFERHYKITGNKAWLEKVYPYIKLGAEWIRDGRKLTKVMIDGQKPGYYGLIQKGHHEAVSEFPGWDYHYEDNFVCLEGMLYAIEAAEAVGKEDDAAWMKAEYENYRKCLKESLEKSMVKEGDTVGFPIVPYKGQAWRTGLMQPFQLALHVAHHGVYNVDIPGINALKEETITKILESVEKPGNGGYPPALPTSWMVSVFKRLSRPQPGYPYERGRNTRALLDLLPPKLYKAAKPGSSYAVSNYGSTLMSIYIMRKEIDKAIAAFKNWINRAYKPTRCWVEMVQLPEKLGLGDMPHIWISATYVTKVRDMLVTERDDDLHITECIPKEWIMDENGISVEDAPTDFGMVTFTIRANPPKDQVEVKLSLTEQQGKKAANNVVIHLRHPGGKAITKVLVDGEAWKRFDASTVNVPPTAKRIMVSFS